MLQVEHLVVFYENALAVNDLSLTVGRGQVVGVFGSNSAGKTTLLNTVAGLTRHLQARERRRGGMRITLEGRIRFEGEDLSALPPGARVDRGIVLCRERHPVFADATVEENLRLGGYRRSHREVRGGLEEVWGLFPALLPLRRRKAGMLSGGEKEMVAIGMALVARPRLLLLDEPLLGLSPRIQAEVVRATGEIGRQGTAVLIAEQYARPVLPIVDRATVIENGSEVLTGSGRELLDHPEVRAAYFGV